MTDLDRTGKAAKEVHELLLMKYPGLRAIIFDKDCTVEQMFRMHPHERRAEQR